MPRFMSTEEGTPCPIRSSAPGPNSSRYCSSDVPHLSFPSTTFDDDETEDLDFTRAIPPEADMYRSAVAPRRKALKEPPRRITTHVSTTKPQRQEQITRMEHEPDGITENAGFYSAVTSALEPERQHQGLNQQPRRSLLKHAVGKSSRRRVSAILKSRVHQNVLPSTGADVSEKDEVQNFMQRDITSRKAQRSQEQTENQKAVLGEKSQNFAVSPKVPRSRQPVKIEKKHLQAPPKRIPLQSTTSSRQQTINEYKDRASGKENIPPGGRKSQETFQKFSGKADIKVPLRERAGLPDGTILPQKKATTKGNKEKKAAPKQERYPVVEQKSRKRSSDIMEEDISFSSEQSDYSDASSKRTSSDSLCLIKRQKTSIGSLPSPPALTQEEEDELILPEHDILLSHQTKNKPKNRASGERRLDPVLNEDLVRCEMYEDNWLSAQEASVSQLLNRLLAQYSPLHTRKHETPLRRELLDIYSSPPFPLIYNRVHASLLYGALSITQNFLDKASTAKAIRTHCSTTTHHYGWWVDVGLREKVLDLFLTSYERIALIAGLEVVVGREMFAFATEGESEKHIIGSFLDRYIVKSEDLLAMRPVLEVEKRIRGPAQSSEDEDRGSPAWLLRRSLLRSFMLILLLDRAKARGFLGCQCLFKKDSHHKSSKSMLAALARLLLPSMGDIYKPLSHLNYTLEVVQQPLSEYDYKITNLAVDLRDGIKLARVVEVLLYSKHASSPLRIDSPCDSEVWPLSPRLLYPANSRAQRINNVSLVLSSLRSAGGDVRHIEAKDIVDGFREKTVGFLWSIVSRWGLPMLLDWVEVRNEIRRFNKHSTSLDRIRHDLAGNQDYSGLLKAWAHEIARKHGLSVDNLTTSFSDGAVFEAIVDEYGQYLPSLMKKNNSRSLEAKLQGIGCSSYFAGLFGVGSRKGRVFNQDFIISALAYLCSRLVLTSITERAAMTIQRAYRRYHLRKNVHRRINLLLLVHDCAHVVNTRNRVIAAAVTIQRAFRAHLKRKIDDLISCMRTIQCRIRGQLARSRFQRTVRAAVVIQRQWRSIREEQFHSRVGFAKQSMIGLQSRIRGAILRQRISQHKICVETIGVFWCTALLVRRERERFLKTKNAALLLQNAFRRFEATRSDRRFFLEARQHTRQLQALVRGALTRCSLTTTLQASLIVQRWWRSSVEVQELRSLFLRKRWATILIQQRRRETVLARFVRNDFLVLKKTVGIMERLYLEKKKITAAALVLQRAWRRQAWLLRMRRVLQGTAREALRIQTLWRGYYVRRETRSRLNIIRKRLDRLLLEKETNEEDKLGNRMRKGLELVKTKAGFGRGILQLELSTRYSRECAKTVAEDSGLWVILEFLDSSVSQMQKSSTSITSRNMALATQVIENLARARTSCEALANRQTMKETANKDPFAVLLRIINSLKMAPSKTPQGEILLCLTRTMGLFAGNKQLRTRLMARKKWTEHLRQVLKDMKTGVGKRRGIMVDDCKFKAAEALSSIFGFEE